VTRLVIAEDSAILREGLVQLLVERGHKVVANVGTADELIEAVAEFTPEVVIVDIRMPPTFTDEGLVARGGTAPLQPRCRRTGVLAMGRDSLRH
jgi:DNA-binding NarL/FixJ family response regulator